jgi:hypothetical protein
MMGLTCCEAAKRYPAIYFDVEIYGDDIPIGTAEWRACMADKAGRKYGYSKEWMVNMPVAKFCSYCGTATPKMKLKDPPPTDNVMECTDTGYHCDTCGERLRCCQCLGPEHNYEPDYETD